MNTGLILLGTDEKAIINLLTTRTNFQRQAIANSYEALFDKV